MYHVDAGSFATGFPPGMPVPPLLPALGGWLAEQPYASLGCFDLFASEPASVYVTRVDDALLRMRARLGVFMNLPEGSRLALWDHGGPVPAVVTIHSEGLYRTLADSLEEFLVGWAERRCEARELNGGDEEDEDDDDEELEPSRHAELAAWLAARDLVVPDVPPAPDFRRWIDQVIEGTERDRAAWIATLPPIVPADPARTAAAVRTLATSADPLLGRFTDEPGIVDYCASLGIDLRTVPGEEQFRSVARFDAGFALEFAFPWECGRATLKDRYPPALRAEYERARRRMLWSVVVHKAWTPPGLDRTPFSAFDGALPWGVTFADTRESLAARFGSPVHEWRASQQWVRPDLDRALTVHFDGDTVGSVQVGVPRI